MSLGKKLGIAIKHPKSSVNFIADVYLLKFAKLLESGVYDTFWNMAVLLHRKKPAPSITNYTPHKDFTEVDAFWGGHTVIDNSKGIPKTAGESRRHIRERALAYPLFTKLMSLYRGYENKVVLDYGCGPGHDLIGFLLYSKASKVIGIDISERALQFASRRLALHRVNLNRVELIHTSDSANTIPIVDNSVDYIYCEGVLHHTSKPEALLKEFYRVLKPGAQACIMVYNCDSIWIRLGVAYHVQILERKHMGLTPYQAFEKEADCGAPIARCYKAHEFISMCKDAGFGAEYVGGYFSELELNLLKKYWQSALQDKRLGEEHKDFLGNLTFDERGFPKYEGKHAGIGGVYRLYKI